MSGTSITVEGDERLTATLHHAADDLADMSSVGGSAGEVVRARAASNAPKVTGRLAGSVRASATSSEVVVASTLVYAGRVQYGMPSVSQPAQPFMSDALRETERAVVDLYARRCDHAMSQVQGA
jgi:phage gpG-like protein